jgi:TRAP-type mannitol/chloroaromatic compound transport system permease small subunit
LRLLSAFVNAIDRFSKWQAAVVCWLIFALIFTLTYEITARYFFGSPTVWAYDFTYILYGSLFMLGAAYTLLVEQHVRIEFIHSAMPPRVRAIVEIIGYLIFFFPAIGALLYVGIDFALESWTLGEHAKQSIWAPPIYPFKTVLPVGAFLLFIQGMANFLRRVASLFGREL